MNIPIEKQISDESEDIPYDEFICMHCKGGIAYSHTNINEHLKNVHRIDVETAKWSEQMIIHSDGDWFYQSCFMIYIDGRPILLRKLGMKRDKPFFRKR